MGSVLARLLTVLLLAVVGFAGCGGGDGDGKGAGRPGDDAGPGPSASGAPVDATGEEAAYAEAVSFFQDGNFDQAIASMRSLGDYRDARARLREFRRVAARRTLAVARSKLRTAPQAAVAQAETSLRYRPTKEARSFLTRARAALRRFQRRQEDDLDRGTDPGNDAGPPAGEGPPEGEGGPPQGGGPPSGAGASSGS